MEKNGFKPVSDSQSEPYRNKVLDGSGIDKFECE